MSLPRQKKTWDNLHEDEQSYEERVASDSDWKYLYSITIV